MRLLGDRAESIRKYQIAPYKFTPDPVLPLPYLESDFVKAIVALMKNLYYIEDDEVLYKLSLQSQPSMWVNVLAETSGSFSSRV